MIAPVPTIETEKGRTLNRYKHLPAKIKANNIMKKTPIIFDKTSDFSLCIFNFIKSSLI